MPKGTLLVYVWCFFPLERFSLYKLRQNAGQKYLHVDFQIITRDQQHRWIMKRLFMGNIFFTLAENAQHCGTCIRADFMDSPQRINIGGQALMFRVGARPDLLQGRCIDAFRKPLPGPGRIHEELLRGSDRGRDQAQEGDDDRQVRIILNSIPRSGGFSRFLNETRLRCAVVLFSAPHG
jgi:hypothetical protein